MTQHRNLKLAIGVATIGLLGIATEFGPVAISYKKTTETPAGHLETHTDTLPYPIRDAETDSIPAEYKTEADSSYVWI